MESTWIHIVWTLLELVMNFEVESGVDLNCLHLEVFNIGTLKAPKGTLILEDT